MVDVLSALMPVLLVVLFGVILRKREVLSEKTVSELKHLLTNNILPVAVFHALAVTRYSGGTWIETGLMLLILLASFGAGFLMRPLVKPPYGKYVPFLVCSYEGGMIAYPLYSELCGSENLYRIAILDMSAIIFAFGIYMNVLSFQERGEKASFKKAVINALKTPVFVASLLGILAGSSGFMSGFLQTGAGQIYTAAVRVVTAPLTTMILLVVGYSIQTDRDLLIPCLKTIGLRALLQAVMIAVTIFAVHRFVGADPLNDKAILIFMSVPTTYSLHSFIRDPQGANFASTFNALYIFITVAVYAAAAFI